MGALSIIPAGTVEISMIEIGEPLSMKIIEEGIVIDVNIHTFESDTALDFEFERTKKVPRLVLESTILRAALENWDAIGQTTKITMSPVEPHFSIKSKGLVGIVQVDFNEELGTQLQ